MATHSESAQTTKNKKSLRRVLNDFFNTEAAGGIVMMFVAVWAIIFANLDGFDILYDDFIHIPIGLSFGDTALDLTLKEFVKDVLMIVFFLFVGLELKREMLEGFLSDKGQKLLPALAATAGVIVPALIYYGVNYQHDEYLRGWAIPTATDIAFAIGILAIIGRNIPSAAKIFLLAIAIYDDIIAIIIIALFYNHNFDINYVPMILATLGIMYCANYLCVSFLSIYYILCGFLSIFLYKFGLHSTIAGVITAFFIPIRLDDNRSKSPLGTAIHYLHPWVSYIILPLFAFVSAGISLSGISFDNLTDPVPLGITLALFLGKQIGIFAITFSAIHFGFVKKPENTSWLQLYAVSVLAGIGFTMSLFIGLLAFDDALLQSELKIGVLFGSLLSTIFAIILIQISNKQDTHKKNFI